jgi:hypothetical protein
MNATDLINASSRRVHGHVKMSGHVHESCPQGRPVLCVAPEHIVAYRALQKYMHEFHADRDHAMCNMQNRSIPAVQLTQLRKLSNKNFQGTGVLKSSQSCQVLQCKVAARQWRCVAEIVSFSGSCSRCLVLSPLPCPTLPKYQKLVCGYCVKGMSVVQGAVSCQQHWYQDHAIRGVAGVHTS